jgi:adenylosuccinate synthase
LRGDVCAQEAEMPVVGVIGGQWGDEGKGKIVDLLAEKADLIVRYSGGPNAGHTVINALGEFKLHLIPSGIFNPHAVSLIGNGTVVSPKTLLEEIDELRHRNVDVSRLFLSKRAHVIMPYHTLLDSLEEKARGGEALGTTLKGVGPAYVDKVARTGIRFADLLEGEALLGKLSLFLERKNAVITKLYGATPLSLDEVYAECREYGDQLKPFLRDTESMVQEAIRKGAFILLEGAQGALLDIDFGTYPYVTSSSPIAGGACIGAGLGPTKVDRMLGVFKAYTTRVGSGPMPTELKDDVGERIRQCAHEFGATTGRPRRCGWFDGVAAKYSAEVNGFTGIALTRLDVLDGFDAIKLCTEYKADGEVIRHFPSSAALLERCEPVYEELPGWRSPTRGASHLEDLPGEAQSYVKRLEAVLGCPMNLVSVGPKREESIEVSPLL